MKKYLYLILVLSFCALASCSEDDSSTDDTNQSKPSVTGNWQDSVKTISSTLKANMQLIQSYQVITGGIQLSLKRLVDGEYATYDFSSAGINGTNSYPAVELTAGKKGDEFKFTGQVSNDKTTLSGTVTFKISGEEKVYTFNTVFEKY